MREKISCIIIRYNNRLISSHCVNIAVIDEIMDLIENNKDSPKQVGIMDNDFTYEVKDDDKMKYFARGVKLGLEISKEDDN